MVSRNMPADDDGNVRLPSATCDAHTIMARIVVIVIVPVTAMP